MKLGIWLAVNVIHKFEAFTGLAISELCLNHKSNFSIEILPIVIKSTLGVRIIKILLKV